MTAINVVRFPEAVHVATDGLIYPSGGKPWCGSKIYVMPHMPMIVATRGQHGAAFHLGSLFATQFESFDAFAGEIGRTFPAFYAAYRYLVVDPDAPAVRNVEIVVAGWSALRDQAEAFFIRGGEPGDPDDGSEQSFAPFKLIELDGVSCGPFPARFPAFEPSRDAEKLDGQMVALMEAQRSEFPKIGGCCQLTSVRQDGISSRILRRWAD